MILSHRKFKSINSALSGAVVLCLAQAATAAEVAPYYHSWAGPLTDAKQNAGMTSAIFAFAVTDGWCALRPGLQELLPQARSFVASGGRLLIGMGGADGVYAEIACTDDNQLFDMMDKLMQDAGTRRLDFDIEGYQLNNTEGTARRARVLKRLQDKYPDLYVSISLPSWLRGFNETSMNVLRTTINAGVQIGMINVMSQSFGLYNLQTMVNPSTVGQATIMGFNAAVNQMSGLYPWKTPDQLRAMMGMTPMIGKNDDGSVFTLDDAWTIANFAKLNGVGMLSYWSFQRDRAQSNPYSSDLNNYSGVTQSDFQYHNIFKSSGDWASAPAPANNWAASPAPAPAAGGSCGAPDWAQGNWYAAGSIVSYGGRLYKASSSNPGYNPTVSWYFWSSYYCSGTADLAAPSAQACSNLPAWQQGNWYGAGSVVSYWNGRKYTAKFANPGYDPTISTYFWSSSAC